MARQGSPMARFHWRVQLTMNRCGTVHVSTTKSGWGPDLAAPISQCSSVEVPSGLKGCQQVRATHAVRWLVDRIVSYVRQWDNNGQKDKNRHSTREVFLGGESFLYWRKCCTKVCRPSWTSYIVALCFSAGYTVGLLWGHGANIAATAIGILLKPRPTIRILVGGGNTSRSWAAPNRTYTTGLNRTGPSCNAQWKCTTSTQKNMNPLVLILCLHATARTLIE